MWKAELREFTKLAFPLFSSEVAELDLHNRFIYSQSRTLYITVRVLSGLELSNLTAPLGEVVILTYP